MRWAEHTERVRNTGNAEFQSKNLKGRLSVGEMITLKWIFKKYDRGV